MHRKALKCTMCSVEASACPGANPSTETLPLRTTLLCGDMLEVRCVTVITVVSTNVLKPCMHLILYKISNCGISLSGRYTRVMYVAPKKPFFGGGGFRKYHFKNFWTVSKSICCCIRNPICKQSKTHNEWYYQSIIYFLARRTFC